MTRNQGVRAFFLAAVTFLLLACSLFSPLSTSPDSRGSILYVSDESGNFEIYHLYFGSTSSIRLTNNTSEETAPFYLPTELRIGYISDKNGKSQIYSTSLTGREDTAWFEGDSRVFGSPAISPDGSQIAYVILSDGGVSNLYLADARGSNEKALTNGSSQHWDPSWSPDGRQIVYMSDKDGDWEIYRINLAGGKVIRLTDNGSYDGHPRWSPDGKWILFDTERGGDWEIYVMDSYGRDERAITENSASDWLPAWSPDGTWIVYVSSRDGDDEIYMVDIDGQNQTKLTDNTSQDRFPVWIP